MIVFEYFFDKMSVFGPKMDSINKVRLFVSLYVHCLCDATLISILHQEFNILTFQLRHSKPTFLIPLLVPYFWVSVFATMPDCRRERTMKRVLLQSL